jgi:hypothetical protein
MKTHMAFWKPAKTEAELDAEFEAYTRKLLGKTAEEHQAEEVVKREEELLAEWDAETQRILQQHWDQVPNPATAGTSYHKFIVAVHLTTTAPYDTVYADVSTKFYAWVHINKSKRARDMRKHATTVDRAMRYRLPLEFCKTYLNSMGWARTSLSVAPGEPRTVRHLNPEELVTTGRHILQCSGEEWYALINGRLVWPTAPDVRHGTRTVFAYWTV